MNGLVSSVLGGAGAGLAQGANLAGGLYLKGQIDAEHQRMAQEAQAAREERNIRLTGEQARQTQSERPEVIPAGATVKRPGQPDYTAPIKESPADTEEKKARAAYLNAYAGYFNRDKPKAEGDGTGKPTLPHVIVKDDGQGGQYLFDENSSAIGTIIPGSPATEPVSHWFKPDEPGKAAQPNNIVWRSPTGDVLQGGLVSLYPDLIKRTPAVDEQGGAQPGPAAAPAKRPPLTSFFSGSQPGSQPAPQAQPRAAAPASAAPAAPAQAAESPTAQAVDAARTKLSAAKTKLHSYGLMQRNRDQQGFAAAQKAADDAQRELEAAMAAYQSELGPVGAATYRVK